jgi:hypothetical protein
LFLITGDLCCDTNRRGYSWRNLSVILPKTGSTTDENPEGTRLIENFCPSSKRSRPCPLLSAAALQRHAARHNSCVRPCPRRPRQLRVRLPRRRRRSGERRKARWPTPNLSCPATSTGKIPLHTPALPPRLGGLLAPARSFERFELCCLLFD